MIAFLLKIFLIAYDIPKRGEIKECEVLTILKGFGYFPLAFIVTPISRL
jgi:hypothetical protein